MTEPGSESEPMPFAIDMLAGVEVLLSLAALGFLGFAALARGEQSTTLPVMADVYPRVFYEPGPTVLALLAGPPLLICVGLVMRKPWARFASILLHVALGLCAVWHFWLRVTERSFEGSDAPELTLIMLFLFVLSIGVPLFLNRRHMRAAFARGKR